MDGHDVSLAAFVLATVISGVLARRHIRRARTEPGRHGLLRGNLLVLAFLLSTATLGAECWLRFFYDSTDAFSLLATTDRWFARHVRRNSLGVRDDREYVLGPIPEGMRRVTFVGDSFTAGHGVRDIRDRFAGIVREARKDWEVHVFATGGLDTGAQLEFLRDRMPARSGGSYSYDLVVLVYCLNDIADASPALVQSLGHLDVRAERGVLARNSYAFDALRFLAILASEPEVRGYFPSVAAAYQGTPWDVQRARFAAIRDTVTARGGRLAVVTFPFLHALGDGYPLRDVHAKLGAFWEGEGVPHLDLLPVFEKHRDEDLVVGAFDAHPNEHAHALAAEAMLPFLDGVAGR